MAESTVRWFIVREKHCWMAADSAEPAKRTGCEFANPNLQYPVGINKIRLSYWIKGSYYTRNKFQTKIN
jgi:hypothetical protein